MRLSHDLKSRARVGLSFVMTALLGAANAAAAVDDEAGESDWAAYAPPVSTGTVLTPTTPEGGFSIPDRTHFDDGLRDRVLDQFCGQIKLHRDFDLGKDDFAGTSVGVSRYLAQRLENKLVLVDAERVRASYGHAFVQDLDGPEGGLTRAIHLGASIEGKSMVVRPIDSVRTCGQLKRLANVFDVKTVLPASPERISKMMIGELWRVPLSLSYSQGLSLGDTFSKTGLSVTFGRSESGAASMTLYRLSEDQTRFRFRIDHAVIQSAGAGVSQTIPIAVFAQDSKNVLRHFAENQAASQISRYTSVWLNASAAKSDGKRVLIEYVVDPRDPEQAKALAQALRGDLRELVRMALRMSTLRISEDSMRRSVERLRSEHLAGMGEPGYTAIDEYTAKTRSFNMNIPFFIRHHAASLIGSDTSTRLAGSTGEFTYHRADMSRSGEYYDVPWTGALQKNHRQRNAEAVTFAEEGQRHSEPFLVYIHNEGYRNQRAHTVRRSILAIDSILALAGAQRGAATGRLVLPIQVLPDPPLPPPPSRRSSITDGGGDSPEFKGYFALTMVISPKAVREALNASTEQVLMAFSAAVGMRDREAARWLADNACFENGRLTYDRDAARARDDARALSSLSRRAAAFLADLAAARDALNNEERAEAVIRLMAGRGQGHLSHEQALAVLIQLIDPMDLTGDFVSTVKSCRRQGRNYSAHFVLKNGRAEVPLLQEAGETKSRFAQQSLLVD